RSAPPRPAPCPTRATGRPRGDAGRSPRWRTAPARRGRPAGRDGRVDSRGPAAPAATRPTAAGCRPTTRRPPDGRRSTARPPRAPGPAAVRTDAATRPAALGRRPPTGRPPTTAATATDAVPAPPVGARARVRRGGSAAATPAGGRPRR